MGKEFKVGDRVRMTADWWYAKKGMTGKIEWICGRLIVVVFDELPKGKRDRPGFLKRKNELIVLPEFMEHEA